MTVPPLGKTGAPPLDEMYWCGDQCPDGWSIIEKNPAPYYQGMRIGRVRTLIEQVYSWGTDVPPLPVQEYSY
jgi:hypothetical protein